MSAPGSSSVPAVPAAGPSPTPGARAEAPGGPDTLPPRGEVVLDVRDLRTYFFTYEGVVRALDGVSFRLARGETTGLVGETGCGKSVTALSIARLVPDPPGRIFRGQVLLHGADLLRGLDAEAKFRPIKGSLRVRVRRRFRKIRRGDRRMEAVRGRHVAMIFQEPTQALNPVFSIANQVGEILFLHRGGAILDEMLGATPDDPGVALALDRLIAMTPAMPPEKVRAAAHDLGTAARSTRLATEAFYIVRSNDSREHRARRLGEALGRLRLSPGRRRYLQFRAELQKLRQEFYQLHMEELKGGPPRTRRELTLRARRLSVRLRHFYFGLPGFGRYVRRPLDGELFWRVVGVLEGVRIANPVQVARGFPHELSGGMVQRVMIAMALTGEPDVLLADEPTTALDVTIQAQILQLLAEMRKRVGTAILLITHDLAVVAEVADRVCVMYAGRIVEQGPVREIFRRPLHPYTQGLLASLPRFDRPEKELRTIAGSVPDLIEPPSGCRYHPRCPHAMPVCATRAPPDTLEGPEHQVACYLYHGPGVEG